MTAELIRPCEEYLPSYLEACVGFKQYPGWHSLHDPDTFDTWRHTIFQQFEEQRQGVNLAPGFVPSTTFWLVDGGEYIGTGKLRRYLTPELERSGGHIGYTIRRDKWGMGYGTAQLRLLLNEAAKLGVERALLTCDESNIASARVMEKNGGVYQDTIENIRNGAPYPTKRYWIDTHCT